MALLKTAKYDAWLPGWNGWRCAVQLEGNVTIRHGALLLRIETLIENSRGGGGLGDFAVGIWDVVSGGSETGDRDSLLTLLDYGVLGSSCVDLTIYVTRNRSGKKIHEYLLELWMGSN